MTTTTTTTPATTPTRYPRYCSECGEGMRTGYQHEEDTSLCYCSLDCAADGLEMTTDELEEAYDNAVNGREAKRPSRGTLVTFEDWTDSPHEDYEPCRAGEGSCHPDADYAETAHYEITRMLQSARQARHAAKKAVASAQEG